ncbi:hypothetical protein [Amycolatopsis sp. lyj-84]|uniref:hypothetical protein n=1 Tax=Amycolatopsis sp. lyj-84 TaxID=2789284 RepID=UPI00397B8DAF
MTAGLDRAWTEAFYAERGLTLLDPEWTTIEQAVSTAPPVPDDVAEQIAAVVQPIKLPQAPPAGTPSARRRPPRRRAERAA